MKTAKTFMALLLGLGLVTGGPGLSGVNIFGAAGAQADVSMSSSPQDADGGGASLVLDNGNGDANSNDNSAVSEITDCSADTNPQDGTASRC